MTPIHPCLWLEQSLILALIRLRMSLGMPILATAPLHYRSGDLDDRKEAERNTVMLMLPRPRSNALWDVLGKTGFPQVPWRRGGPTHEKLRQRNPHPPVVLVCLSLGYASLIVLLMTINLQARLTALAGLLSFRACHSSTMASNVSSTIRARLPVCICPTNGISSTLVCQRDSSSVSHWP